MDAPNKVYVEVCEDGIFAFPEPPFYESVEYIRADLVEQPLQQEQPEADLEEEAYMRGFAQGAKEEREAFTPLINRLCEAILFEWEDAAGLARETLTQIKAREE